MAAHSTTPKNKHQIRPEARFPNTAHRSTWKDPSISAACLTCQCGCKGNRLYACETSDLKSQAGALPPRRPISMRMRVPRSCNVSSCMNPPSAGMSEFRDLLPALWSLIRRSLSVPGFGTAKMGWETIPGKGLEKASEYRPSLISVSRCERKNSRTSPGRSSGCGCAPGASEEVSAYGQKPDSKPAQRDSTRGRFG